MRDKKGKFCKKGKYLENKEPILLKFVSKKMKKMGEKEALTKTKKILEKEVMRDKEGKFLKKTK